MLRADRRRSARWRGLAAGLLLAAGARPASACAVCGCSLSTDGAMGFVNVQGWRLVLQTDYLDQDQLRFGRRSVSADQAASLNTPPPGLGQEVEHRTLTRTTTLGLLFAPGADWSFQVQVPYLDRFHETYGGASSPVPPEALSTARVTGLGDARVIVGYGGLLPGNALTLQAGLKLPTGAYGGQNPDGGPAAGRNPASFGPSGDSAGQLLDASLQAGTGSTDLLLGFLYHQAVTLDLRFFVSGQFQGAVAQALDRAGSDFRPGNQERLTLGLRYEASRTWVPQLQVNLLHRSADQGALADVRDSAGTLAFLSPGAVGEVAPGLQAFAFLQVPVYSNLSGYQLFPRWAGTAGLAWRF